MAKAIQTKERTIRPTVISFRITEAQEKILEEIKKRTPIVGAKSIRQMCRKIVSDYLAGRLDYKNPAHKLEDLEFMGKA